MPDRHCTLEVRPTLRPLALLTYSCPCWICRCLGIVQHPAQRMAAAAASSRLCPACRHACSLIHLPCLNGISNGRGPSMQGRREAAADCSQAAPKQDLPRTPAVDAAQGLPSKQGARSEEAEEGAALIPAVHSPSRHGRAVPEPGPHTVRPGITWATISWSLQGSAPRGRCAGLWYAVQLRAWAACTGVFQPVVISISC